jgi:hypothetical protein
VNITARCGAALLGHSAALGVERIGRHATLHVTAADRTLEGDTCRAFAHRLVQDVASGHVIVPFWSAHQVTIGLLALERFGLRSALAHFEIVADDSFAGEIMNVMGKRLGLAMRRIHVRGNAKRLEDVGAWMRNPRPFFIAIDGGSEYETVPTGIIRMAARLRSTLWPLAVRALPSFHVPGLIADFPRRGSRVALGIASPFRVDRSVPVASTAMVLKHYLDTATVAADACFAPASGGADEVWMRMECAS